MSIRNRLSLIDTGSVNKNRLSLIDTAVCGSVNSLCPCTELHQRPWHWWRRAADPTGMNSLPLPDVWSSLIPVPKNWSTFASPSNSISHGNRCITGSSRADLHDCKSNFIAAILVGIIGWRNKMPLLVFAPVLGGVVMKMVIGYRTCPIILYVCLTSGRNMCER